HQGRHAPEREPLLRARRQRHPRDHRRRPEAAVHRRPLGGQRHLARSKGLNVTGLQLMVTRGAVLVLAALYRAVRSEWPPGCYRVGRRPETGRSQTSARFTVYRFAAVALAAASGAALLDRQGDGVPLPLLAVGARHGAVTAGRGLVVEARAPRT